MPQYDATRFSPPAPVANVTVRAPESNRSVTDVPMLIDTGSDVSLLPRAAIDFLELQAVEDEVYRMEGFDGNTSVSNAVRADLIIGSKTFRGLYLPVDRPWGVLGRNVLNHVVLILDGPQQTWDVRQGTGED